MGKSPTIQDGCKNILFQPLSAAIQLTSIPKAMWNPVIKLLLRAWLT